jgi:membrane protease YdiL (CAAX protease family)
MRLLRPIGGVLALGLLHALWHLPLFDSEYGRTNGLPWLLAILAYTIFTAWLYQRTGGNLLLPALLHASLNTSAAYVFAPMEAAPTWCACGGCGPRCGGSRLSFR